MAALLAGRTTSLNPVMLGGSYGMSVGLGDESFTLIFDTGSSDLWVAESGFQCDGFLGGRVPPSMCHSGPLFSGNFEGGEIPNQNFHLAYGGGEFVSGRLGYEDVIVAGVTVNHQEIAFVDEAFWDGDDLTSGIVGFAYSSLTSAYTGTDPANDDPATNNVHYTNFIGNAIKQGKIDPMFSHVLERGPNGGTGQLALGGLPPIDFDHNFTSVPLQIVEFDPSRHIAATNYTYYTIELHSVVLNGAVEPTKFPVVVDSGTTLAYLPSSLTRTINKAFDPPSKLIDGLWENDCSATPPSFSFCIGGKDFHINPAELLLPKSLDFDESSGNCVSIVAVQSSALKAVLTMSRYTGVRHPIRD